MSGAAFQCDTAPKYGRCYLSGPGGVIYVLGSERQWSVWSAETPTP